MQHKLCPGSCLSHPFRLLHLTLSFQPSRLLHSPRHDRSFLWLVSNPQVHVHTKGMPWFARAAPLCCSLVGPRVIGRYAAHGYICAAPCLCLCSSSCHTLVRTCCSSLLLAAHQLIVSHLSVHLLLLPFACSSLAA